MQNQMNNGDFAILYRNAQSRSMEDALRKQNSLSNLWWVVFYEERNKDVLCYLRLVINQKMKALMRVINYPAR
jgi:superfamily I DNA/RNA helicase